eukprot:gene19385-21309_t
MASDEDLIFVVVILIFEFIKFYFSYDVTRASRAKKGEMSSPRLPFDMVTV